VNRIWKIAFESLLGLPRKWLVAGITLRIIFMPFTMHGDLVFSYWASHFIGYEHVTDIFYFFSRQFGVLPTDTPVKYFFYALMLLLLQPLMPYGKSMMSQISLPNGTPNYMLFYANPNVYSALFLFKIPYLFFDFGTLWILMHLVEERNRKLVFKFWMVNPVVIFVSYIFGGYDIIPVFFVALSLLLAKLEMNVKSLVVLGVGGAFKLWAFFLLPFYIVGFAKSVPNRIKLAIAAVAPYFLMLLAQPQSLGISLKAFSSPMVGFVLGMNFQLGFNETIYVFVAAYTLVFFAFMFSHKDFDIVWKYSVVVMLLYYALCRFHPQYFLWLIPFVCLVIGYEKKFITLHALQILCYVVYTFYWGGSLAGILFAPLNPTFFYSLPSPSSLITAYFEPNVFIGIFRSIFTGITIWMILLIFRSKTLLQ